MPPPRAGSSLPPRSSLWGWRARAPADSAAVSGGCCRTPAHLRDTRRGVTPRTFRQLPPRSLRPPCREREGRAAGAGGVYKLGGCPTPAHCHPVPASHGGVALKRPVLQSWGVSTLPGMDRQMGPCLASGWVGGRGVAAGAGVTHGPITLQGHGPHGCSVPPCSDPWAGLALLQDRPTAPDRPTALDRPTVPLGKRRLSPTSQLSATQYNQHRPAWPRSSPEQPSITRHSSAEPRTAHFQPSPFPAQPNPFPA